MARLGEEIEALRGLIAVAGLSNDRADGIGPTNDTLPPVAQIPHDPGQTIAGRKKTVDCHHPSFDKNI
ncbi:hypothetical protein GGQ67_003226 [Rhizobium metallidurans]|uniref:Uncharacterized protein n=1 Tax=Rhizobium metallidurans TaxID=1265931 RepID=A0A7W6CUU2_9HYPH|nr:hypothetical protein [Rhizobium metallidurans]